MFLFVFAAVIALNDEWHNINVDSDLEMKLRECYPFIETDCDLIDLLNEWIEVEF